MVSGAVQPDTYTLSKEGPRLLSAIVGHQSAKIVRGPDAGNRTVDLPADEGAARVLSDEEAVALARLGVRVEQHYGTPQDVEWAVAGGAFHVLQARPIATLAEHKEDRVLLHGLGASPGVVAGRVRILASPDQGADFRTGEVLVAPMTSPDWVPTMRRATALVTDAGGMTGHAAIVSRSSTVWGCCVASSS